MTGNQKVMIKHYVIIIPGLGDNIFLTSLATKNWQRYGLQVIIYPMKWRDGEDISPKLDGIMRIVDKCYQNGDRVSLVGCSAGGSAVLNVFLERKNIIHKVVVICGRLKVGNQTGFRSLQARAKSSPAFAQSVKLLESRQNLILNEERKKIMSVRSLVDELVPSDTSVLRGARNITMPIPEHSLCIYMSLSVLSSPIIQFLTVDI